MAICETTLEYIASALERRALLPETVTCNDLAAEVGLSCEGDLFADAALNPYFQQMDADDCSEQRPFRTALIVSKTTGRPNAAFFTSLRDLLDIDATIDNETLWRNELRELAEYYRAERTPLTIQLTPAQGRRLRKLCRTAQTTPASLLERTLSNHLSGLEDRCARFRGSRSQIPIETIVHELVAR